MSGVKDKVMKHRKMLKQSKSDVVNKSRDETCMESRIRKKVGKDELCKEERKVRRNVRC